ncbi:MAG: hypothetical protein AAGB31_00390 [Bdellovibrio sp.]
MSNYLKKNLTLLLILTSVQAFAMSDEDIMRENTEGKIQAAMADRQEQKSYSVQTDAEFGRIAASQILQIKQVREDVDALIELASQDRNEGSLQKYQLGQLSFLADSYVNMAESTDNAETINQVYNEALNLQKVVDQLKKEIR